MSYEATSVKLTGNPDSSGWSQTYDFKPDDPEKFAVRGHLFAVISISSQEEGIDLVVAGREVLARLHEEYFGKLEERAYIALKNVVEKVIGEFSSEGGVEISAVTSLDSTLYAAAGGGASILLFRRGSLHKLIESNTSNVIAASGKPKDDDRIIFGTKAFFEYVSRGEIVSNLKEDNLSSAIESFAGIVHSKEREGNVGVMVLQFGEQSDEEKSVEKVRPILSKEKDEIVQEKAADSFARGSKKISKLSAIFEKFGKKSIRLKEREVDLPTQRSKKTSFLVGILLLIILSVSIYFGVSQKRKADLKASYETQLVSAEHELQESYSLYLLNPQRSRELFNQARSKIENLSVQGVDDPKLEELKAKIKEGEENILGQYSITPELFVDLNLFSEGFKVDSVTSSSDTLYILDESSEKIIEVSLDNKRTQIYAGPVDVKGAKSIASYSGRVFIATRDGIYELDSGRIGVDENGADVLIGAYAGNLYVLEKGVSRIYRYPAITSGFGTKKDWLREGVDEDLSGAKSMVIDGMIWVLVDESKLIKFSLGNVISFSFEGVYPEIEKITDIYTDEDSEYLYVLEKDAGRVIVTNKDGEYKVQYLDDGMKDAKKLVVSESEKKIFLLTENKILSFELKHLD